MLSNNNTLSLQRNNQSTIIYLSLENILYLFAIFDDFESPHFCLFFLPHLEENLLLRPLSAEDKIFSRKLAKE